VTGIRQMYPGRYVGQRCCMDLLHGEITETMARPLHPASNSLQGDFREDNLDHLLQKEVVIEAARV
jgi:hypothetical protein